jgi:formylglycine-generating enzyme required for sulfatase activity
LPEHIGGRERDVGEANLDEHVLAETMKDAVFTMRQCQSFRQSRAVVRTVLRVAVTFMVLASPPAITQDYQAPVPSVVKIVSVNPNGKTRTGTGFVVELEADSAYILTARHVVEDDKHPTVFFRSRRDVAVNAEVVSNDVNLDVSLVIVRGRVNIPTDTNALELETSVQLNGGEQLVSIGFEQSIVDWVMSSLTVGSRRGSVIIFSGAVDDSSSGGPVFLDGKIVGMITGQDGVSGSAIPSALLLESLKRLNADGAKTASETQDSRRRPDTMAAPMKPGHTFKDCDDCPEMVVVPAGNFVMGSTDTEEGHDPKEGPVHVVTIPAGFAVSKFEITRGQFARFVLATARYMSGVCYVSDYDEYRWKRDPTKSWRDPGFSQTDDHPVVCVSFEDATAYAKWLGRRTGQHYRLLSEAEWEYTARAGTTTMRFWGDDERLACTYANVADHASRDKFPGPRFRTFDCDDRYAETAPVGQFAPNAFGLYDTLGSVWEWTQDCRHDNYEGAPVSGVVWRNEECFQNVIRGSSFEGGPAEVRSAYRGWVRAAGRYSHLGFRVARTIP